MELLPIGPVNLLDTAGIDDVSLLSEQRIERTKRALDRSDVVLIVIEPNNFTHYEEELIDFVHNRKLPYIVIINKTDKTPISDEVLEKLQNYKSTYVAVSSVDLANRGQIHYRY
jgi:small GTP-binding protein